MNDNELKEIKKLNKILNNLIADEWITTQLYTFWINALINMATSSEICSISSIVEVMDELRVDEFDDHFKALVKVSNANGFDIPLSFKDMMKHASEDMQKMLSKNKKDMTLIDILDLAIAAEQCAIGSYQMASQYEYLYTRPDIQVVINGILVDEIEHIDRLFFIRNTMTLDNTNNWYDGSVPTVHV